MIQFLWLWQIIRNTLVNYCALGLWLATTSVALAEYQPPADQKPPSGYSQSTGSRGGCERQGETALKTLAPQKHVGQTASLHPTFAWFVPEAKPLPMEFTLYKYASGKELELAYKTQLKTSPGIMKLSLPKDKPGLSLRQRYLWQVAILCDANHPSSDLVAKAEIEVVEMPRALIKEISQRRDRNERIERLAAAGLWYDALAAALADSSLNKVASSLLEDLAKLEEPQVVQVSDWKQ